MLGAVHLFAGHLRFVHVIPRSRWLSAAGGASVAYVFIHIFPELAAAQRALGEAAGAWLGFIEHHAYLVALAGLVAFYGLERLMRSRAAAAPGAFGLHIGSFAAYNGLIGYLVVERAARGGASLALFALAMGLHFFVNDYGLRKQHRERYDRVARWVLAAALAAGALLRAAVQLPEAVVHLFFAVVAGATILNVMKEELPEERESRFSAFLAGAAAYAALLVAL